MTSYVVYSQIISGDNIIINPKYKIDMIACVINMILIAVSLLLLFLLHIPADTRSAFPVISVQSPVSIQCCWQS